MCLWFDSTRFRTRGLRTRTRDLRFPNLTDREVRHSTYLALTTGFKLVSTMYFTLDWRKTFSTRWQILLDRNAGKTMVDN